MDFTKLNSTSTSTSKVDSILNAIKSENNSFFNIAQIMFSKTQEVKKLQAKLYFLEYLSNIQ